MWILFSIFCILDSDKSLRSCELISSAHSFQICVTTTFILYKRLETFSSQISHVPPDQMIGSTNAGDGGPGRVDGHVGQNADQAVVVESGRAGEQRPVGRTPQLVLDLDPAVRDGDAGVASFVNVELGHLGHVVHVGVEQRQQSGSTWRIRVRRSLDKRYGFEKTKNKKEKWCPRSYIDCQLGRSST